MLSVIGLSHPYVILEGTCGQEAKVAAIKSHNYFFYITTNPGRTVLYAGMTNDLQNRIDQHKVNRGNRETFAGRYYCYK